MFANAKLCELPSSVVQKIAGSLINQTVFGSFASQQLSSDGLISFLNLAGTCKRLRAVCGNILQNVQISVRDVCASRPADQHIITFDARLLATCLGIAKTNLKTMIMHFSSDIHVTGMDQVVHVLIAHCRSLSELRFLHMTDSPSNAYPLDNIVSSMVFEKLVHHLPHSMKALEMFATDTATFKRRVIAISKTFERLRNEAELRRRSMPALEEICLTAHTRSWRLLGEECRFMSAIESRYIVCKLGTHLKKLAIGLYSSSNPEEQSKTLRLLPTKCPSLEELTIDLNVDADEEDALLALEDTMRRYQSKRNHDPFRKLVLSNFQNLTRKPGNSIFEAVDSVVLTNCDWTSNIEFLQGRLRQFDGNLDNVVSISQSSCANSIHRLVLVDHNCGNGAQPLSAIAAGLEQFVNVKEFGFCGNDFEERTNVHLVCLRAICRPKTGKSGGRRDCDGTGGLTTLDICRVPGLEPKVFDEILSGQGKCLKYIAITRCRNLSFLRRATSVASNCRGLKAAVLWDGEEIPQARGLDRLNRAKHLEMKSGKELLSAFNEICQRNPHLVEPYHFKNSARSIVEILDGHMTARPRKRLRRLRTRVSNEREFEMSSD